MALLEDRRRMVGERLAELREQKALTLHDLEELSGVGADGISKIENGHRKPRPSTLRKLARALGVEVEDFFREPAVPLAEAPREAGPDFADLPGLDAALRRHGMRRGELAYRAGMTPGELFDYEVGAKKPPYEIVTRLAAALSPDCFPAELGAPPEQAEAFLAENQQQNAVSQDKRDELLQDMREERLRNPATRRTDEAIKEEYRKNDEQRAREHPEAG
jgi:transcriptional regulator with XRE-family HTH domain